jgi:hypothetical protein
MSPFSLPQVHDAPRANPATDRERSAPLIRPLFSRDVLGDALGFALPRVPHSIAHQVIGFADRYFLNAYGTLRDVGLYSIGASFALALKFFLGAFEAAWTPFFLGLMRDRTPGAFTAPDRPTSWRCSSFPWRPLRGLRIRHPPHSSTPAKVEIWRSVP